MIKTLIERYFQAKFQTLKIKVRQTEQQFNLPGLSALNLIVMCGDLLVR